MEENEKSASFIDVVVFAAENWLLIVLVPSIVAIIFYAWQSGAPKTYIAILDVVVPREISEDYGIGVYPPLFVQSEGVQTSLTSRGFTIQAEAHSSGEARNRAEVVFQAATAPLIAALVAERQNAETILAATDDMLDRMQSELAAGDAENAVALLELEAALDSVEARIDEARAMIAALEVIPQADIVRRGMSPTLLSALAGLAAAVVLVALLAIRQRWRMVAATDEGRQKVRRIKDAFALRHLRH